MSEEKPEAFLSRWSRLKRETEVPEPASPAPPVQTDAGVHTNAVAATAEAFPAPSMPPIDSITVNTDITPYLQATVDQGLKRMALKKLFQDPHFHFANMDKLDTYIDDYSIADPLPEGMLQELKFAQDYIFKDPTLPETEMPVPSENALAPTSVAAVTAGSATAETPGAMAQTPLDKMSQPSPVDGDRSPKD